MADKKQTMLYGLLTSIADKITYDNSTSGLTATNVQDAIDEMNEVADITSALSFESIVPTQSEAQANATKITKVGKVVTMSIRFTTPSTVISVLKVASINPKYAPVNDTFNVLISNSPSWSGTTGIGCLRVTKNGTVELPHNTWAPSTDVSCIMTWIIN